MTTPIKLELVWADAGGTTDPTDAKYQLGWVAEIPTFQNFNHVLKALDSAKLSYAEGDIYPWQDLIAYKAGARVVAGDKTYYCITPHNDSAGSNPQDPQLDSTYSYWVTGTVFSSLVDAFNNLTHLDGVKVDEVTARNTRNLWENNDLTIANKNAIISLVDKAGTENLVFGNVQGKLVVVEVGTTTNPDGVTSLRPTENVKSHEIYHEGHKPTQSEVEGTIPDSPQDGRIFARQNKNWLEIKNTNNSNDYGLITGVVDSNNDYGSIT